MKLPDNFAVMLGALSILVLVCIGSCGCAYDGMKSDYDSVHPICVHDCKEFGGVNAFSPAEYPYTACWCEVNGTKYSIWGDQ